MDDQYESFSPPARSAALDDYELRGQSAGAALTDSASRIRANNAWPEPTRAREMLREQQLSHQLGVRCPSDACGADGAQTCTLSPDLGARGTHRHYGP